MLCSIRREHACQTPVGAWAVTREHRASTRAGPRTVSVEKRIIIKNVSRRVGEQQHGGRACPEHQGSSVLCLALSPSVRLSVVHVVEMSSDTGMCVCAHGGADVLACTCVRTHGCGRARAHARTDDRTHGRSHARTHDRIHTTHLHAHTLTPHGCILVQVLLTGGCAGWVHGSWRDRDGFILKVGFQ